MILLAPVEANDGESLPELADRFKKQGFVRLRINGEIVDLDGGEIPEKAKEIELVLDRLVIREDIRSRLAEAVEAALRITGDKVIVLVQEPDAAGFTPKTFVTTFTNPETGFTLANLTPKHFSFNSHLGACPKCHGLGTELVPDPELMVPDPDKTLTDGGVKTWWSGSKKRKGMHQRAITGLAQVLKQDVEAPIRSLSKEFKRALFFGSEVAIPLEFGGNGKPFEGLSVQAKRLLETSDSEITKRNVRRFMSTKPCKSCEGRRLKPAILAVTLPHQDTPCSIHEFSILSIERARTWLDGIELTDVQARFATEVIGEIAKRLEFLAEVGLGYLTLDRESGTLSGGESQRIRLATQLGAGLAGVLYVLDEPSIGLHQADNEKLIATLQRLRDLGNSIIVVEAAQAKKSGQGRRTRGRLGSGACRDGTQPEERGCGVSAGLHYQCDGSVRQRQIDVGGRHSATRLLSRILPQQGSTRRARSHHRLGPTRQSHCGGSNTDRKKPAFKPGNVFGSVRADP